MENCYATTNVDRYASLTQSAKDMCNNPTEAEKLLWNYLRANRLGEKFRRQHPIDDYVADFICLSKHLVVELDGGCHTTTEHIEHDKIRDKRLTKLGFKTLRFTNEQVFSSLDFVINEIKKHLI